MSSGKWRPFCLGLNVLNCLYEILDLVFDIVRYILKEMMNDKKINNEMLS